MTFSDDDAAAVDLSRRKVSGTPMWQRLGGTLHFLSPLLFVYSVGLSLMALLDELFVCFLNGKYSKHQAGAQTRAGIVRSPKPLYQSSANRSSAS